MTEEEQLILSDVMKAAGHEIVELMSRKYELLPESVRKRVPYSWFLLTIVRLLADSAQEVHEIINGGEDVRDQVSDEQ